MLEFLKISSIKTFSILEASTLSDVVIIDDALIMVVSPSLAQHLSFIYLWHQLYLLAS